MNRLFSLKTLLTLLVVFFFASGGYVGYLSALVDIDEQLFFQQVSAQTDKQRLERQLARAKSILEARSRAYLRRSQAFIRAQQAQAGVQVEEPVPEKVDREAVQNATEALESFEADPSLSAEQRKQLASLQEEQQDLGFFEDEVDVIGQILEREYGDEDIQLLSAGERKRRRISDALRQLLKLLDKRRELATKRKQVKKTFSYWEQYPQSAPGGLDIAVQNKGSSARELNPLQVTQISSAMAIMPQDFDRRIRKLYVVYGDPKMRRGMAGVGVVFIKGEELDFFRVLVHEFGHIHDLHREVNAGEKSNFYDGQYRLFQADPSVTYYLYGWESNHQRTAGREGYASSYGMTDPFEDFAEAFALYVLQGQTFRNWAQEDSVMAQKYAFILSQYDGRQFPSLKEYAARPYDVTMMVVDYDNLLQTQ